MTEDGPGRVPTPRLCPLPSKPSAGSAVTALIATTTPVSTTRGDRRDGWGMSTGETPEGQDRGTPEGGTCLMHGATMSPVPEMSHSPGAGLPAAPLVFPGDPVVTLGRSHGPAVGSGGSGGTLAPVWGSHSSEDRGDRLVVALGVSW